MYYYNLFGEFMAEFDKKVKANHLVIEEACMKDYNDLTEKDLRIQLAASYRLVEELGWSFLIFGHFPRFDFFRLPLRYLWDILGSKEGSEEKIADSTESQKSFYQIVRGHYKININP